MSNPADRSDRTLPDERGDALSGESTVALIERVRAGDEAAANRLLSRHLAPLQRWARGRLPAWARGMTDTDDLVQDTMLQTFKRLDEFEPRRIGGFQAYLRRAILNRIRDELRRSVRRGTSIDVEKAHLQAAGSPLEDAIGQELLGSYERALAQLETDDREAVIGRLELGYSYEELATLLGKPTADAARKAAQRAVARLAEGMKR